MPKKKSAAAQQVTKQAVENIVEAAVQASEKRVMNYVDKAKKEIIYHFDAVVENIHQDVAGANRDEILFIKDKVKIHEHRITALEQR